MVRRHLRFRNRAQLAGPRRAASVAILDGKALELLLDDRAEVSVHVRRDAGLVDDGHHACDELAVSHGTTRSTVER